MAHYDPTGLPDGPLAALLVAHMAEALVFADKEGVIRAWNPSAEALFGFTAAEALGRSLDLIIPERLRPAHWQGYDRALAQGATRLGRRVLVTRAQTAAGGTLYVDMSFAVVADAQGQVLGALAVARDATARYQEEKALRARLAALEKGGGAD